LDSVHGDIYINNQSSIPLITRENIDDKGFINQNTNIPIILPTKQKFIRTLMEHTYYDLTRFYSNELEREQSVLFCFGFSFADEHIRSITQRALGNPSLTLLIFPFSESDERSMLNFYKDFHNVKIIRIDENDEEGITKIDYSYAYEGMPSGKRKSIEFNTFTELFLNILSQVARI
jgi:hypothetical protein